MNIGIYNPYFNSYGGGERYSLTLASHWSKSHRVSVFWDDASMLVNAQKRLSIDLTRVTTTENIFKTKNRFSKLLQTKSYDLIFFLSDGSVPMSLARYNILHFQVPFAHVSLPFWKRRRYQRIVCNSEFTRDNLDSSLAIPRLVIYPPVETELFKSVKKEKTIVAVGRFNALYGAKKYEILIDAFRLGLKDNLFNRWKLQLAGGLLDTDKTYLTKLQQLAQGLPVDFFPNCSLKDLQRLYGEATIYWHAAGFGESDPERMEHFGMSTVEAMSAGCIPVVFNGGGQREIIQHGSNGFLWNTREELLSHTKQIIEDAQMADRMKRAGIERSKDFDTERFISSFDTLLKELS